MQNFRYRKCAAQTNALAAAGCEIIRYAVLDEADAYAIKTLKTKVSIPIVADIHFSPRLAVLAVENGADKLRINPGNIGGEKEIALMKKNAILLNTARGPVVDSEALAKALNEERIAGAGIDVFEMEPPVPADHPLLHSKHTVVTPHVAFASHEALFTRAQIVSENILKWEDGKPQNVIC